MENFYQNHIYMNSAIKTLSQAKITNAQLSQAYQTLKPMGYKWLDIRRNATRPNIVRELTDIRKKQLKPLKKDKEFQKQLKLAERMFRTEKWLGKDDARAEKQGQTAQNRMKRISDLSKFEKVKKDNTKRYTKKTTTNEPKVYAVHGIVTGQTKYWHKDPKTGKRFLSKYVYDFEHEKKENIVATSAKEAKEIFTEKMQEDYESGDKDYEVKVTEVDEIKVTAAHYLDMYRPLAEIDTPMKSIKRLEYDFFKEDTTHLKNTGYCVVDNFVGVYGQKIKKVTREWFIEQCKKYANKEWKIEHGVTPGMLESICKQCDISCYGFDVTRTCFSKFVSQSRSYKACVYYCINGHMNLISDKKDILELTASAREMEVKTNSVAFKKLAKQKKEQNIFDVKEIYEDIPIDKLGDYNDCIIIYNKNHLNRELEDVIKYFNIVPTDIKSCTNCNVLGFRFKNIHCCVDPNASSHLYTWKDVKKMCDTLGYTFKNQSFMSVVRELREHFFKHERIEITDKLRNLVFDRDKCVCKVCQKKYCKEAFDIDHIKPLSAGGKNELNNMQLLCKGCHKVKSQQESETGVYIRTSETHSSFNEATRAIFDSELVRSYAFVETLAKDIPKFYNQKIYKLDINKCRKNMLYYSNCSYPLFTVMDEPVKFEGNTSQPGIYYIETDKGFPLHGNGWYSQPMVKYCLQQQIITKDDIKYVVYASLSIKRDYFNAYIDELYKLFGKFNRVTDEGVEIKFDKLAVNGIVGCFKPKDRHCWQSKFITNNSSNAFAHYLNYDAGFIHDFEVNDTTYYHVYREYTSKQEESEMPLYNMILDMEAVQLHKLAKLVESKGGVVLDLATDCVSCCFKKELPFDLIDGTNNIDGYFYDDDDEVPIYKLECTYDLKKDDDLEGCRLKSERMPRHIRKETFSCAHHTWTVKEDVHDNDFTPLVEYILNGESCHIDGLAGCGKSTLVRKIQAELDKRGLKYEALAPTNKACRIIDGRTIHKFVLNYTKTGLTHLKANYIFIDEVSMISENFYKFFCALKRLRPDIKYIIAGDFAQLPPVCDRREYDYINSYALWELCDGRRVQLSNCRRSNKKYFNMIHPQNIHKLTKKMFGNKFTNRHLSYTNAKRKEINKIMMDKLTKHKQFLRLKANENDEKTQDLKLIAGMPVLAKKNNNKLDVVNNESFTIETITRDKIVVNDDFDKTVEMTHDEFVKNFIVAFCITVHCSQGSTFDYGYTIHEWEKFDNRLKYVALSRSTHENNVNIV